MAGALGMGASVVTAGRGEPIGSAVDTWAIVHGASSGGLEGEHKLITGFMTCVASVGSAGGEPMVSSVGIWGAVLEAASRGVEGRHRSMTGWAPCGPMASGVFAGEEACHAGYCESGWLLLLAYHGRVARR